MRQPRDVQRMFDEIAPTYDFLNHVLSFGMDIRWRKRAVRETLGKRGGRFLDLAAGTGDFSVSALRTEPRHLVAVDFALHTLLHAREKFKKRTTNAVVNVTVGDAHRLPFRSGSFDCVLVAFGVRNFQNIQRGLEEIYRVLRTTGIVCILELSRPKMLLFANLFRIYFHTIVPRVGQLLSKHRRAYRYLPESVDAFPVPEEIMMAMTSRGFREVKAEPMTFGVVTLYTGRK
jgi:demethylmenaquinone methyltransferase/2-methoxy-6-polyprenyl-1,4-benzoquinol methylase